MAYKIIVENCSACGACESECPNQAISMSADGTYSIIDPNKCKECVGSFDSPQCASVCPNDACVPA
jgi:ferredoxin